MKLTAWFSISTCPSMVGWYETRIGLDPTEQLMRWWDGKRWKLNEKRSAFTPIYQAREWRGLRK